MSQTTRGTLYNGWIYTSDPERNIYVSTGGTDTGRLDAEGRRIFTAAGMVCDEGDAAVLPPDGDPNEYESVVVEW